MAKKGYIIETRIAADNTDALNRSIQANVDLDGGTLVELGTPKGDVFTATQVNTTGKTGLWMVYNPSEHYIDVNGNRFAGLSQDPRDYTNLKNRPADAFKPQKGDLIGFTKGNIIDGDFSNIAVNDYLEPSTGGQYARKQTSPTADTTSFKVIQIKNVPMPQAGIGYERMKVFIAECVNN